MGFIRCDHRITEKTVYPYELEDEAIYFIDTEDEYSRMQRFRNWQKTGEGDSEEYLFQTLIWLLIRCPRRLLQSR